MVGLGWFDQEHPRKAGRREQELSDQRVHANAPVVPEQVSVAMDEIATDVREGLLALAFGAGLQVMQQMMAADVTDACGPKDKHDPEQAVTRHGSEAGLVSLGGRRVSVERPRMRAVDRVRKGAGGLL